MRDFLKFFSLLMTLISLVLMPVGGVVADTYTSSIQVSVYNNSSADYGPIAVIAGINNTQLATFGNINSTGLNTDVSEASSSSIYSSAVNNTAFFASSYLVGQEHTYTYMLGSTPGKSSFPIVPGYGGYVTTPYSAGMNVGSNFSISLPLYLATNSTIFEKRGSLLSVYDYSLERVYLGIPQLGVLYLYPASDNSVSIESSTGAATHWDDVDDAHGAPDDGATVVYQTTAALKADYYNLTNATWSGMSGSQTVANVTACHRVMIFGGWEATLVKLGASTWTGAVHGTTSSAWATFEEEVSRPGGGTWTVSDFGSSLLNGVEIIGDGVNPHYCTQAYLKVNYYYLLPGSQCVFVDGVSPGEYSALFSGDGANLSLTVGATNSTAIGGGAPVNTNGWVWGGVGVIYFDSVSETVGGVQKLLYEPDYLVASSNLVDETGSGNTGTIVWGSNPAGFEVDIGPIEPLESYVPPGGSPSEQEPPTLFTTPVGIAPVPEPSGEPTNLPDYSGFERGAESLGWTTNTLYGVTMFETAIALGVGVLAATGSLLAGGIMFALTLGTGAGVVAANGAPIIPWWIPALALMFIGFLIYLLRWS